MGFCQYLLSFGNNFFLNLSVLKYCIMKISRCFFTTYPLKVIESCPSSSFPLGTHLWVFCACTLIRALLLVPSIWVGCWHNSLLFVVTPSSRYHTARANITWYQRPLWWRWKEKSFLWPGAALGQNQGDNLYEWAKNKTLPCQEGVTVFWGTRPDFFAFLQLSCSKRDSLLSY